MGLNWKVGDFLNKEFSREVSWAIKALLNLALAASILFCCYSIVMLTNQESFSYIKSFIIAIAMGTNIYVLVAFKKIDAEKSIETKKDEFSLKID
jgi:MFS superfamily sulfate permease-like transporter